MTDFGTKLQKHTQGNPPDCLHPIGKIFSNSDGTETCSLCGKILTWNLEPDNRIAALQTENAQLRGVLEEIASTSPHLEDEVFEEMNGIIAMIMRRLARQELAKATK